jgi:hypothetical protein
MEYYKTGIKCWKFGAGSWEQAEGAKNNFHSHFGTTGTVFFEVKFL